MARMRNPNLEPLSYIYLDEQGIESLYAQTVEMVEIERSKTTEKTVEGKLSGTARLKNLVLKALGGPEVELTGEISGARSRTEHSKHEFTVENKLAALLEVFRQIGTPIFVQNLGEAARHVDRAKNRIYFRVEEKFDAPQFFAGEGAISVNKSGYLILEKACVGENNPRDDYFKDAPRPLVLSASVKKMRTFEGQMAITGHDAIYFRGYGGRRIPLGVFGIMTPTPSYFHIKPYAIWR
ncbi:MAG TPA: hypothetical protein VKV95_02125 [Terriglobia bacterium]|nr:hypothetical protein [Terriglobia bacterium]